MQFAKKATTVESELEKEIEELRKVRRATLNDDDKQKQKYLETLKRQFKFAELGNEINIRFLECSILKEELSELYKFINFTF